MVVAALAISLFPPSSHACVSSGLAGTEKRSAWHGASLVLGVAGQLGSCVVVFVSPVPERVVTSGLVSFATAFNGVRVIVSRDPPRYKK